MKFGWKLKKNIYINFPISSFNFQKILLSSSYYVTMLIIDVYLISTRFNIERCYQYCINVIYIYSLFRSHFDPKTLCILNIIQQYHSITRCKISLIWNQCSVLINIINGTFFFFPVLPFNRRWFMRERKRTVVTRDSRQKKRFFFQKHVFRLFLFTSSPNRDSCLSVSTDFLNKKKRRRRRRGKSC